MRVAFDASCLVTEKKSGIAYYTESLITHMAHEHPEIQLVGHYCNFLGRKKNLKLPRAANITYRPTKLISARMLNLLRRLRLWIPFELLIKDRADFHLFPAFIGWPSLFGTPSAPVVHDLTYVKYPEFVSKRALHDLQTFVPQAIKRASFVITISQASAELIGKHYGVAADQIVVTHIPPAGLKRLSRRDTQQGLKALGVAGPFILFLGTLEPRKNVLTLLKAYVQLKPALRDKFSLVIAGASGWLSSEAMAKLQELTASGLNIKRLGYVTNDQRTALLSEATTLVLPSFYEGFGMPLLEAMACDTAVVASDIPVFHEVCSQAALYFNPESSQDLTKALEAVLADHKFAKKLINSGQANLKRFSWAEVTDTIYRKLNEVV